MCKKIATTAMLLLMAGSAWAQSIIAFNSGQGPNGGQMCLFEADSGVYEGPAVFQISFVDGLGQARYTCNAKLTSGPGVEKVERLTATPLIGVFQMECNVVVTPGGTLNMNCQF